MTRPQPTPSMAPIKKQAFGYEQARHLLWRAGFGGTPQQINLLASWGPERAVDYLLDYEKVPFAPDAEDAFDRNIIRPATPEEQRLAAQARRAQDEDTLARVRLARMERERDDRRQMREIQKWWLARMIETPRPLEEKLTLFWHGHFATSYRSIEDSYHMYAQNRTLRAHALGNFGELLRAIIRDPAMLAYLNNNTSRKQRPNENLARELMELFSLGVSAYTERDIKEGARALTGFSFTDDQFVLRRGDHDPNPKTVLGDSGVKDGDDFVRVILAQPACSRFVARKLYHFFCADLPPIESTDGDRALEPTAKRVVEDLAAAVRSASYELRPALRRLLLSEHFYDPAVMGQHIKSPAELLVGAIRSLNTPVRDVALVVDALDLMGQDLFYPPSVKGWDGGRSWINTSTLYVRQNALAYLLTGQRPKGADPRADREVYDPMPLLAELTTGDPASSPEAGPAAEYLLRFTIGSAPTDAKAALVDLAGQAGGKVTRDVAVAMLLVITAMPEYQLC